MQTYKLELSNINERSKILLDYLFNLATLEGFTFERIDNTEETKMSKAEFLSEFEQSIKEVKNGDTKQIAELIK